MKMLYLDCSMGAAGDMLAAALFELVPDREAALAALNAIGIPGVRFTAEPSTKCGIVGTHMRVTVHGAEEGGADTHAHPEAQSSGNPTQFHIRYEEIDGSPKQDAETAAGSAHDAKIEHTHPRSGKKHAHTHSGEAHTHDHPHTGVAALRHLVNEHLQLPEPVRASVLAVYDLLAEAESHVHGVPVPEIHFHEVGTLDAVADISAVCLLLHLLAPDRITVSPIHVGSGQVRCAHGLLPVPAPATAWLLREVPIYGGSIRGELCTPTGAALLRHFASEFGPMPPMRVASIGYGMGTKDFLAANCVRAMLGEDGQPAEQIFALSCNLDDMTGEAIGFAMERLLEAGALDVYTTAIGMKKSRPGVLLRVLCRPEDRRSLTEALFRHTTTLGVRELALNRFTLERKTVPLETPLGVIRRKEASGFGVTRSKYEYEDLAALAREKDMSLGQIIESLS